MSVLGRIAGNYMIYRFGVWLGGLALVGLCYLVFLIVSSGELRYVRWAEDLVQQDPATQAQADFASDGPHFYRLRDDDGKLTYPQLSGTLASGEASGVEYTDLDLLNEMLTNLEPSRAKQLNEDLERYARSYNAAMAKLAATSRPAPGS